jgi:ornithine carbamoyltransferase
VRRACDARTAGVAYALRPRSAREIYEQYGLDGMEVTDQVFESRHPVVVGQAGNRMHTIKAVMVATLGE